MKIILFNKIKRNIKNNKGFTLVEVVIACTIITITVLSLMNASGKGIELSGRALKQTQANTLLEEGAEAVKIIRDTNWDTISSLSLDTPYYLFFNTNTNTWSLSDSLATPASSIPTYPIDETFSREIVISLVNRDGNDDISESGTNLDSQTKKITVTVSWYSSGTLIEKDLIFYLADIFN